MWDSLQSATDMLNIEFNQALPNLDLIDTGFEKIVLPYFDLQLGEFASTVNDNIDKLSLDLTRLQFITNYEVSTSIQVGGGNPDSAECTLFKDITNELIKEINNDAD